MGNETSLKSIDRNKYTEISQTEHPILERVSEVEDRQTKQKFLVKRINLVSDIDNMLLKQLTQRQSLNARRAAEHIICLHNFEVEESSNICGKDIKAILYIQYLPTDLASIILQRKRENRPFDEQQILTLMHQVTDSLISLHDYGLKNIHLSSQSIVQSNNFRFKVIDTLLTNKADPFIELLHKHTDTIYFAPEELEEAKRKNNHFMRSPKCDIFTLALIVIEVICMQPLSYVYNYEKYTIDIPLIHKILSKATLSERLKNILRNMLLVNEDQRVGLLSLKLKLGDKSTKETQSKINAKKMQKGITRLSESNRIKKTNSDIREIREDQIKDIGENEKNRRRLTRINIHKLSFMKKEKKEPEIEETPASKLQKLISTGPANSPNQFVDPISPIRKVQGLISERGSLPSIPPSYHRHTFNDGAVYQGDMNYKSEFEGNGTLFYPNGKKCYSGSWTKNCFNGYGVLQNDCPVPALVTNYHNFGDNPQQSWDYYEGDFRMDAKDGFGNLVLANGDRFTGSFKHDLVHGLGTFFQFKTKRSVKGEWIDNILRN